ncbi:hypothetical protein D3C80_1542130 [compost metagenome]
MRFRVQAFAGTEEVHKEVRHFAPDTPFQERQVARRFRVGFPFGQINARYDIGMVDIQIVRGADVELLIHTHTAQIVQHGDQQIFHRQITVLAEQHDTAIRKGIFRQFVAQTPCRRPAKRQEIFFTLTLQAQALPQLALFVEHAIGFVFGTVNTV